MTIIYFGDFNPEYARNKVIIKGLRENGVEVLLCHTSKKRAFAKILDLVNQYCRHYRKCDMVIVGYSDSRFTIPLAWLMSSKPVIWDAFYSLYDSWVFDRRLVPSRGIKAGYYWFLDWLSGSLADLVLMDTNEHIDYFSKTFRIKEHKFIKVLVGSDPAVFHPQYSSNPRDGKKFLVHFHGNYIPLQGIESIIKAAKLLEHEKDIQFNLVGNGQTYHDVRDLADREGVQNVTFIERVDIGTLAESIAIADICLGIFGNTKKAQRVIPNKVYEAVAMAKPVITSDTPAIREVFTDRKNILLCRNADAKDLARAIKELRDNAELRNGIAKQGYALFNTIGTPVIIGRYLAKDLETRFNHGS
jgi:glycosyltransferase involved in cell wall biosynthesis